MELVIKLPDETYKDLMKYGGFVNAGNTLYNTALRAIVDGSILPTEHGDLIDRNLLRTKVWSDSERRKDSLFGDGERLCLTMIDEATPVVPANNHSENYNEWLNSTTHGGNCMTRQKAIELLQTIKVNPDGNFVPLDTQYSGIDKDYQEAINKAISWLTMFTVRGED